MDLCIAYTAEVYEPTYAVVDVHWVLSALHRDDDGRIATLLQTEEPPEFLGVHCGRGDDKPQVTTLLPGSAGGGGGEVRGGQVRSVGGGGGPWGRVQ